MKNKISIVLGLVLLMSTCQALQAQTTLWTPGGFTGTSINTRRYVGIGTDNPQFKLHVVTNPSTLPAPQDEINNGIRIEQTGSSGAVLGLYNTAAGLYGHKYALISTNSGNTQGAGKLLFYDYNTPNPGVRMCIDPVGLVGIGTYNPAEKLHVDNGVIRVTGSNSMGGPMIVFGGTPGGSAPSGQWGIEYTTSGGAALSGLNFWRPNNALDANGNPQITQNNILFLGNTNSVGIKTNNTSKADFTVNGKVLIGNPNTPTLTTPGTYGLYVENGILTKNVKVALPTDVVNWSDYVFEPDYARNSLEFVSAYVKANKHLPNVPSSNEVCENGIDVAQMDAALLRQIEELWLHVIDLKKENDRLKKIIETGE